MNTEIKKLIKESKAIKKADEAFYLRAFDYMDEGKKAKFLEILKKEKQQIDAMKSDVNKKYVEDMKKLFKVEQKKAMNQEEAVEREESEKILVEELKEI
jgi:hypothetical protein